MSRGVRTMVAVPGTGAQPGSGRLRGGASPTIAAAAAGSGAPVSGMIGP